MLDRRRARFAALAGVVAALVLSCLLPPAAARAQATVFNQNEAISLQILSPLNVILPSASVPCVTEQITLTPDGQMIAVVHGNLQGVVGVTPSGTVYRASGAGTDVRRITVPTPVPNGLLDEFLFPVAGQLTGPGLGNGLAVSLTLHEQIFKTANGFVVVGGFASAPQLACQ
jgi:hypothetical protein